MGVCECAITLLLQYIHRCFNAKICACVCVCYLLAQTDDDDGVERVCAEAAYYSTTTTKKAKIEKKKVGNVCSSIRKPAKSAYATTKCLCTKLKGKFNCVRACVCVFLVMMIVENTNCVFFFCFFFYGDGEG